MLLREGHTRISSPGRNRRTSERCKPADKANNQEESSINCHGGSGDFTTEESDEEEKLLRESGTNNRGPGLVELCRLQFQQARWMCERPACRLGLLEQQDA